MRLILAYNQELLERIDALLLQLSDDDLAAPRAILFGSSIGGHFRHILEFYTCLLTRDDEHRFSYDRRRRDPVIEESVIAARACASLCNGLLADEISDRELIMASSLPGDEVLTEQRTTLARELAYLADHSVHHLAMVRIALEQELPHVQFPGHLGVAASTRNHQAQATAAM
ncbi:MAG: hypothetical protein IPK70_01170 [Flavobacteriales bacterium]|jgi:uncharacterized damage-inducible protein DinB|nr:hypothetical protein [Flavobacteriales bacterium]